MNCKSQSYNESFTTLKEENKFYEWIPLSKRSNNWSVEKMLSKAEIHNKKELQIYIKTIHNNAL